MGEECVRRGKRGNTDRIGNRADSCPISTYDSEAWVNDGVKGAHLSNEVHYRQGTFYPWPEDHAQAT